MSLRQSDARRHPLWLADYHVNATIRDGVMEDAGCPNQWHITKVKILKRFGEAMRTPQQVEWYTGMEKEVKAMFLLGVLVPIDETEAPKNAVKLGLMWQFQVKTDDDGYITRFRPRIVGLGNRQEPGVDSVTSFSPVAWKVTF